jgi:uncharacterized cupredoxin-like copper-binding protein
MLHQTLVYDQGTDLAHSRLCCATLLWTPILGEPSVSPRLAALALLSLLALAGCGAISSQSASESSTSKNTPTAKSTLVAPTATITANQVTLTTDHATYKPGDSVRVTIANGRGVSIYAIASNANCSVLVIHAKTAAGWQTFNATACSAQGDPQTVEVKPGSAIPVTITAPAVGTYRCALQYTTINVPPPRSAPNGAIASETNPTSGPAITAYSAQWDVTSA